MSAFRRDGQIDTLLVAGNAGATGWSGLVALDFAGFAVAAAGARLAVRAFGVVGFGGRSGVAFVWHL